MNRIVRLSLLATAVFVSACASTPDEQEATTDDSASALTSNEDTAYKFFVGKGLKNFQAAGIVGNLIQESNVDPGAVQPNDVGHGIAQWSEPGRWNTDPGDNVESYAASHGASALSLGLQLDFVWYELTTFSEFGLARLRATTNVSDATIAFEEDYEECGNCEEANRISYAKSVLASEPNPAPPKPTPPKPGPPTRVPAAPTGCGEIQSGRGLVPGRTVRSCDDRFELVVQSDGNLVEYGPLGALWSTGTSGDGGYAADMQSDGNFVLYNKTSNALFETHTNGDKGAYLALQNDGNLVVRGAGGKAEWNAGVSFTGGVAESKGCGEIKEGFGLVAGQSIEACGGKYDLVMQTDGNLVLYTASHAAVWSTRTNGKHGYKVQMQGDGNFVLYDQHAKALWSTGTSGHAGAFFAIQPDANLVVYAPGNHAVWTSGTER